MSDYYKDASLVTIGTLSASDLSAAERIGLMRFEVILDKNPHVYYPGQIVAGKIQLQLNSPIRAVGLKLKYSGKGLVSFTNRSAGFRRKESAEEQYLHDEVYLTKNESSTTEIKSETFPFSFALPEELPCSFEGRYGRVRYTITSTLEITEDTGVSTDQLSFTVAPVFDLNHHSLAPLPISENHAKTLIGQTEPLSVSVFLPVRGYVPGQKIPLKINLKNHTKVDVKKLRIVFKKVVIYSTLCHQRKHKEIVVEIEQLIDDNSENYDNNFDLPALPPSGKICKLIDVNYTLKVESCIDVNEWYYRIFHKNIKVRMSIIVGTIPLKNYEEPLELQDDSQTTSKEEESIDMRRKIEELPLNELKYKRSRIYRSSKPERDDPQGVDGENETEVTPYSPMYRVYKFEGVKDEKKK